MTLDSTTYYARNTYSTLSGTEYQYAFSGGAPLAAGHIKVDIDTGAGWENKAKTDTTFGWSVNTVNSTVTFDNDPSVAAATQLRIRRDTPMDERLADFESGGTLPQSDLDTDSLQAFYGIQEILDTFYDAMVLSDVDGRWEARSIEVRRGADATAGTSLTTLSQVQALIGGGNNATLNSPIIAYATGDGSTQEFDLRALSGDSTISGVVNTEVFCWVGSEFILYEERSITDGYKVNFTNMTPANGDRILFALLPATVAAVYEENLVDTPAIRDSAVTSAKILDLTIATGDIAALAITEAKLAALSVTNGKLGLLAVDTGQLAANAVTSAKTVAGLNKTPTYSTPALTKEDIFSTGSPGEIQNSSGKLREVSIKLRVNPGTRWEFQLQVSSGSGGGGTTAIPAQFSYPTSGNQLYTFKALVPDTWWFSMLKVTGPGGNPEDSANVTLEGVEYCDFAH